MTELERQAERQTKQECVEWLRQVNMADYSVQLSTDQRIAHYIQANISNPDDHNVDELLGLKHFFQKCQRFPDWQGRRVRQFYTFIESLPFDTDGGKTIKLSPIQAFQFANIFGFVDGEGRRLTRTAYIYVPRKYGKTTMIAGLGIWDFLFGPADGEQYIGANSTSQAKILFNIVRGIMKKFDPNAKHYRTNREEMYWVGPERRTQFVCLSSTAKTKDGLNANLAILDEFAQSRDLPSTPGSMLKDTLTTSMGVRKEPLTVVITTASDVTDGPFARELEGVQDVLRGKNENWSIFASLFHPDCDDAEDDPHTWAKVQPHLGYTVQKDFYQREWADAQLAADKMLAFRTKQLNIFCKNETTEFIPARYVEQCRWEDHNIPQMIADNLRWKQNGKQGPIPHKKLKCYIGIDLATKGDISAVCYLWKKDHKLRAYIEYFLPERTIAKDKNTPLYEDWVENGYLRPCGDAVIDDALLFARIKECATLFDIQRVGYDQKGMREIVNRFKAAKMHDKLEVVLQGAGTMGYCIMSLEEMMMSPEPKLLLCYNPMTEWMFSNVVLDEDSFGNRRPMKATKDSPNKIDGVAALLDAVCIQLNAVK